MDGSSLTMSVAQAAKEAQELRQGPGLQKIENKRKQAQNKELT